MSDWTTQPLDLTAGPARARSMRRTLADLGAREVSPLALMCIGLLVSVVALWVPIRLSTDDAEWATATVVDRYLTNDEESTFENLSYTFLVDGRKFSGSSEVNEATYRRVNIGDSLPVRYAGGDPSVNRYVADRFVNSWEFAVGVLWLLLIPGFPVAWWRSRSRGRKGVPEK